MIFIQVLLKYEIYSKTIVIIRISCKCECLPKIYMINYIRGFLDSDLLQNHICESICGQTGTEIERVGVYSHIKTWQGSKRY